MQSTKQSESNKVYKKWADKQLLKVHQKQNEERKSAHSDHSDANTSATSDNSNKLTVQQPARRTAAQRSRNTSVNMRAQAPKMAENKKGRATSVNPTSNKNQANNSSKLLTKPLVNVQVEIGMNGQNQVQLFQAIPKKTEELLKDMTWIRSIMTKHCELNNDSGDQPKTVAMGKKLCGGISGVTNLINLTMQSGAKQTYVLKCNNHDNTALRSYREGIWYSQFMPEMRRRVKEELNIEIEIPKSHFAVVDPKAGRFFNCMEFIENSLPLNDVFEKMTDKVATKQTLGLDSKANLDDWSQDIVAKLAKALANMHGAYFLDKETRQKGREYLKAAKWFDGENKKDWQDQMKSIQDTFKTIKQKFKGAKEYPTCFGLLESSIKKVDWEKQVEMIQDEDFMWTSVHGDFWPNQTVYSKTTQNITLFDFEDAGFWNPTIDLVNFMIHWPVDYRHKVEKTFLETYHARLSEFSAVPKSYTYDRFMEDFKTHGAGRTVRWMILLWWLGGEGAFRHSLRQVEPFLKDYGVDIKNVPMPSYGMC